MRESVNLLSRALWGQCETSHYVHELNREHELPVVARVVYGQYRDLLGQPTLSNPNLQQNVLIFPQCHGKRGDFIEKDKIIHEVQSISSNNHSNSGNSDNNVKGNGTKKTKLILAQCVKFKKKDGNSKTVVPYGPTLAIPDTFRGYFEILSEDGRCILPLELAGQLLGLLMSQTGKSMGGGGGSSSPDGSHKSGRKVVSIMIREPVRARRVESKRQDSLKGFSGLNFLGSGPLGEGEEESHKPYHTLLISLKELENSTIKVTLNPGDVVHVVGEVIAVPNGGVGIESNEKLFISNPSHILNSHKGGRRYVCCMDSRGYTVLLDVRQKGKFSPIASAGSGASGVSGVHPVTSLLTKRLPLMVRLITDLKVNSTQKVQGLNMKKADKSSFKFVPELRLYSAVGEDRILFAMPLDKVSQISAKDEMQQLFALPHSAPVKLQVPMNMDDIRCTKDFIKLYDKAKALAASAMKNHIQVYDVSIKSELRFDGRQWKAFAPPLLSSETDVGGHGSESLENQHDNKFEGLGLEGEVEDEEINDDDIDEIYDLVRRGMNKSSKMKKCNSVETTLNDIQKSGYKKEVLSHFVHETQEVKITTGGSKSTEKLNLKLTDDNKPDLIPKFDVSGCKSKWGPVYKRGSKVNEVTENQFSNGCPPPPPPIETIPSRQNKVIQIIPSSSGGGPTDGLRHRRESITHIQIQIKSDGDHEIRQQNEDSFIRRHMIGRSKVHRSLDFLDKIDDFEDTGRGGEHFSNKAFQHHSSTSGSSNTNRSGGSVSSNVGKSSNKVIANGHHYLKRVSTPNKGLSHCQAPMVNKISQCYQNKGPSPIPSKVHPASKFRSMNDITCITEQEGSNCSSKSKKYMKHGGEGGGTPNDQSHSHIYMNGPQGRSSVGVVPMKQSRSLSNLNSSMISGNILSARMGSVNELKLKRDVMFPNSCRSPSNIQTKGCRKKLTRGLYADYGMKDFDIKPKYTHKGVVKVVPRHGHNVTSVYAPPPPPVELCATGSAKRALS